MGFTKFKYEEGTVFNNWTLVKNMRGQKSIFRCNICNKEYLKHTNNIFDGRSKRCKDCRAMTAEHKTFTLVKQTAKRRKIKFLITEEEWLNLATKNCYYCDSQPKNCIASYGEFKYNGLDRIDTTKEYVLENVVPCCRMCNTAKSDHDYETFLDWIEKIYERKKKGLL